ncbi:MAG: helix-turn-helix domain-containing GNAT family N-acetyltransferase [Oligoflexia bacterium]|nr:helix-turn-helix domain-containing GNAT family N-acetyltransferase [Oligoflexia bacterium]
MHNTYICLMDTHMLPEPEKIRQSLREIVREWGLMHTHPCVSGVTLAQGHALIELQNGGELTIAQLASRLQLDHSSASRLASRLVASKLAQSKADNVDGRQRVLTLTAKGRETVSELHNISNQRVLNALNVLPQQERALVDQGLAIYARALRRVRQQEGHKLRPIRKSDDQAVARIIRTVMPEFGANGPGFAINDPEVDYMSRAYSSKGCAYFVLEKDKTILGGGGLAPLQGGQADTCELRKMYLLPEARGLGMGEQLLQKCLDTAKQLGYKTCYLETTSKMIQAQQLYQKLGFKPLQAPLGATGHCACDRWYSKEL